MLGIGGPSSQPFRFSVRITLGVTQRRAPNSPAELAPDLTAHAVGCTPWLCTDALKRTWSYSLDHTQELRDQRPERLNTVRTRLDCDDRERGGPLVVVLDVLVDRDENVELGCRTLK